ncbi:MAG: hypothetical protein JWR10_924 [Rubritepida sp.]|nr:hypothetical protein [Rubritepida sp.]
MAVLCAWHTTILRKPFGISGVIPLPGTGWPQQRSPNGEESGHQSEMRCLTRSAACLKRERLGRQVGPGPQMAVVGHSSLRVPEMNSTFSPTAGRTKRRHKLAEKREGSA